jgi:putative transcriptional regulator
MALMPPATRRLLVAAPTLVDPNFARSVVFVVEHDADGALGFVVNRAGGVAIGDVLPDWASLAVHPAVVFDGGPVQREDAAIALAQVALPDASDAWQPLLGRVGSVDLGAGTAARPDVEEIRVFAGYAGWGPGQLDDEVERGDWHVVEAEPGDLLDSEPESLWRRVLRRQGGGLAAFANQPFDASTN